MRPSVIKLIATRRWRGCRGRVRTLVAGGACAALAAGLLTGPPAEAAPKVPPAMPGLSAPSPVGKPATPRSAARRPSWPGPVKPVAHALHPPAPGTATVTVGSGFHAAGRLPVAVATGHAGKAATPSASDNRGTAVSKVTVTTLAPAVVDHIGGRSIGFRLRRADGAAAAAPVTVRVDTSSIVDAYGAGFAARLRLVQYPGCVLTAPDTARCATATPVASTADPVARQVTAVIDAGPAADTRAGAAAAVSPVYALVSAATTATDAGNFSATPLKASDGWVVGEQAGSFTYTYPLPAAPSTGGDTPSLALAYDSAAVDGLTSHENNQSSPVGLGWNLAVPFIEHRMTPCTSSGLVGNLCWGGTNFTLSMAGHSSPLNYSSTSGNRDQYRTQDDQGWRIEQVFAGPDNPNGDDGGVYWKVTMTDGTKYYFGRENTEWSATPTNSTLSVTMYAQNAGDVCWSSTNHHCPVAWRWNLAYVVDPVGNLQAYQWEKGRYSYQNPGHSVQHYDGAGYLTSVRYGMTTANATAAPAPQRIDLAYGWRCDFAGCRAPVPHDDYAANYPDVPFDLWCSESATSCSAPTGPAFFYLKKLDSVTATVYNGSGYTPVDRIALDHGWPEYQDQSWSAVLWLRTVTHSGYHADGTTLTMPAVSFAGDYETWLPNRWDRSQAGTYQNKPRITDVTTELGGRAHVTYGQPNDCGAQTLDGNEDRQTTDCYPSLESNGHQAWFRRYLVTRLDVIDRYGAPSQTTGYEYDTATGAAWHSDNDPVTVKDQQSWSDYRGYYKITVRTGTPGGPVTTLKKRFFRGMDGDHLKNGSTRSVTVNTSDQPDATGNLPYPDSYYLKGLPIEERSMRTDGTEAAAVQHEYAAQVVDRGPAGPWGLYQSGAVRIGESLTRDMVSAGGVLRRDKHTVRRTYDATYGLPVSVQDDGDPLSGIGPMCSHLTYVRNTDLWIIDAVATAITANGSCPSGGVAPTANLTGRTDTYYDGNFTSLTPAPTAGLAAKVVKWASAAGAADSATEITAARYDGYGRAVATIAPDNAVPTATSFDTAGPATTITYAQPNGPVTGSTTTDPAGQSSTRTLDPGRGVPLSITDTNRRTATITYDALGRLTNVRLPGDTYDAKTFTYTVSDSAPSVVVTAQYPAAGAAPIRTWQFLDSLGRTTQTQTTAPTGGILTTGVRYDDRGNTAGEVASFAGSGTPGTVYGQWYDKAFADALPSQRVHAYDDLNRETTVSLVSLGAVKRTTTVSYDGTITTTTPPSSAGSSEPDIAATTAATDLAGHLLRRGQGGLVTTNTYDPAGRLTKITSPAGAVSTFGYDWLGRRTTTNDPDAGTSTADYYPSGAVKHTRDANGNDLFSAIDVLSRQTATYAGTSTSGALLSRTTYDGAAAGATTPLKGTITSITSFDGSTPGNPGTSYTEAYSYDNRYRITRTDHILPASLGPALAGTYTSLTSYDGLGRRTSVSYPAAGDLPAETVTTGWDGAYPGTLTSPLAAYVSATAFTGIGQIAGRVLGAGGATGSVRRAYTWDTATGDLLVQAAATPSDAGSAALQYDSYTYAPSGNITRIDDAVAGQQQCFSYDPLDRLTAAGTTRSGTAAGTACATDTSGPLPYRETYTYDDDGDLTTLTHNGLGTTFGHGSAAAPGVTAGPHAPTTATTAAGTTTSGYDAAGQLVTRRSAGGATSYTWDVQGRLTATATGGTTATFTYGPDGGRWVRSTGRETVVYLGGQELHLAAGAQAATAVRSYGLEGHTVAVRRSGGTGNTTLSWILADRQDSATLAVDATSGAVTRGRYLPYGGDRDDAAGAASTMPSDRGWLGEVQDRDTGLDYLNNRYYDPATAHFISSDPLNVQETPQSGNPYTYAADNPVAFADPTGLSYTVQKGDDWYDVAGASGLSFDQLRSINGGSLNALRVGQVVNTTLPGSSGSATGAQAVPSGQSAVYMSAAVLAGRGGDNSTAHNEAVKFASLYIQYNHPKGAVVSGVRIPHGDKECRVLGASFCADGWADIVLVENGRVYVWEVKSANESAIASGEAEHYRDTYNRYEKDMLPMQLGEDIGGPYPYGTTAGKYLMGYGPGVIIYNKGDQNRTFDGLRRQKLQVEAAAATKALGAVAAGKNPASIRGPVQLKIPTVAQLKACGCI